MWHQLPMDYRITGPGLYRTKNGCRVELVRIRQRGHQCAWEGYPINTKNETCRCFAHDDAGQGVWHYTPEGHITRLPAAAVLLPTSPGYNGLSLTHMWRPQEDR